MARSYLEKCRSDALFAIRYAKNEKKTGVRMHKYDIKILKNLALIKIANEILICEILIIFLLTIVMRTILRMIIKFWINFEVNLL